MSDSWKPHTPGIRAQIRVPEAPRPLPNDPVADPQHYKAGDYECRAIQKALARTLWSGSEHVHELCNALKYIFRCCSKGKFSEDIRKAAYECLSCVGEDWRMRVSQTDWQQYLASKAGKVET
jgi:hypothetical protein